MSVRTALLFAIAALALSCGPSAGVQPTAGTGNEAQPRYGGQINSAENLDPDDWDITTRGSSGNNWHGLSLSHNSLLGFKLGPDIGFLDTVLEPELAERWEISPDARTFTFQLRKGVKFANIPPVNGRELTAADVKWTVEYYSRTSELKDKKLPTASRGFLFEGLVGVEAPDPYTVSIRFKDPYVPFVNYAASRWIPILGPEIYRQDGHYKDRMAGTGPFILGTAGSQKGTRWVWKKNPDYWDPGKPYLDSVRWLVLPAEAAHHAAFQTKQLDLLQGISYQPYQQLKASVPQANVLKNQGTYSYLALGQAKNPALTDIRVRRAISLALDRDAFVKVFSGGEASWAVPGLAGWFTDADIRQLVRQDVEEGKRLMAEAGYAAGLDLDFPVAGDYDETKNTEYELVQAQLKRVGINARLTWMPMAEHRVKRRNGDYDLDMFGGGTYGVFNSDVDSYIYAVYHSTSINNNSKVKDVVLDQLLGGTRKEVDPAKRLDFYKKAVVRIVEQAWSPAIFYPPRWDLWHPHVKNFYPHFTNHPNYRFSWLDK